jgi:DNA-binding MarR family transcriptional regulator
MDDKQAQGMIFGFFNEVGIVSQLSGALFGRLVPQSVHLSHFIVLNHLTRIGDGRTPVQIANALQVTKATMTHTLAVLSRHGFIAMEPHPTDRRSKMVRLTPAGRSFRDEAIDSMSPAFQYLADNISIDELKAVLPVLEKVRRLLDAERDAPVVG